MIRSVLRVVFHVKVKCQGHTDVEAQQAVAVGAGTALAAVAVTVRDTHCVCVTSLTSKQLTVVHCTFITCKSVQHMLKAKIFLT